MKNIRFFYLKIFHFLVVKFSIYLNRHIFVMKLLLASLVSTNLKFEIQRIQNPADSKITKTRLFKYTEHFTTKKVKFSDHISAQNI